MPLYPAWSHKACFHVTEMNRVCVDVWGCMTPTPNTLHSKTLSGLPLCLLLASVPHPLQVWWMILQQSCLCTIAYHFHDWHAQSTSEHASPRHECVKKITVPIQFQDKNSFMWRVGNVEEREDISRNACGPLMIKEAQKRDKRLKGKLVNLLSINEINMPRLEKYTSKNRFIATPEPLLGEREREREREREIVCTCVCVCVTMKKSARRMASTTSDTGDTSSN